MIWSQALPSDVASALEAVQERGRLWLVGGAVRDHFLDRATQDFDFTFDGDARALARSVADALGSAYYDLDAARGTGRVLPGDGDGTWQTLDFAELRGEDIEDDLRARDFTINALAVRAGREGLLDPTGGLQDLREERIRLCLPGALRADPIRALRAVRLGALLSFRLDAELVAAIRETKGELSRTSVERRREELFRILALASPERALRVAAQLGLLQVIFPDLSGESLERGLALMARLSELETAIVGQHDEEATAQLRLGQASLRLGRFRESLERDLGQEVSGGRRRRQLLVLSALLLGECCGGGRANRRPRPWERYRLSRREASQLGGLSGWACRGRQGMRLATPTDRAIYRHFRQLGRSGVEAVLLALACARLPVGEGKAPPEWIAAIERAREYLLTYYEGPPEKLEPAPLLRGDELMAELQLEAGPRVGRILEALREAQAAGEIKDRGEALELARELGSSNEQAG